MALPGRDVRRPAAVESLGGHDLVRPGRAQGHSLARPRVDVVAERDVAVHARGALRLARAEVLPESLGALDGGLVDLLVLVDVVRAAVAADRAHVRSGRPVGAPAIDDVVLDEWVPRPTIEGQIGIAVRRKHAGVVADRSDLSGAPAFAGHEVL